MDAKVYKNALLDGLDIPEGKYYLADAGFPSCDQLLIPYRVVRYHLAVPIPGTFPSQLSFDIFNIIYRPRNKEKLFNLQHASAHNIIEHIFGVLKRRFCILLLAPEYSLQIQARIPAALCAIHNFITIHNPADDTTLTVDDDDDNAPFNHDHEASTAASTEIDTPLMKRDCIAQVMWDNYLEICQQRGIGNEDSESETSSDLGMNQWQKLMFE